ncbi:membrane-bound serine racemase VanT [Enterococcus sp. LJL120]
MNKQNASINNFRLLAAVMVVAIHCYPFQSFAPELDTLITLTLFRVAVPFFLMVTGYYLIGPLAEKKQFPQRLRVKKFLKKQLYLYLAANLLYLPLALYSGEISLQMSLAKFLQALIFEGFLYHLWYFPALLLGVFLVSLLLRKFSLKSVLSVAIGLYLIGLGGDSWWGITRQLPFLKTFYNGLFHFFGLARNGLFLVPLFLVLGAILYQKRSFQAQRNTLFLIVSAIGLLVESFALHHWSRPRHDSMYLLLPLVMYFLFQEVLHWQSQKTLGNASRLALGIYLFHPYMIAVWHFIANKVPLLKNSLINFLVVLLSTFLICWLTFKLLAKLTKKNSKGPARASKQLSTKALKANLAEINRIIPEKTKVMAVVKANAYGTDANIYAKTLAQNGVDFFAVATLEEGIALREAGIAKQILILGYTSARRIKEIKAYDLVQTIVSEAHAAALNQQRIAIDCHLKVDTGMHRLGVEDDVQKIKALYQLPYLKIKGIYSHLGSADEQSAAAKERTEKQIAIFNHLLAQLKAQQVPFGVTHLQSSYGILNYPDLAYDYVRPGILLYGCLSSQRDVPKEKITLTPVVEVQAQLISKKWVAAQEYLGYSLTTQLSESRLIGVVSIGYADGIPRNLSQTDWQLTYQDHQLPQIGRICMDMLLIDLTACPEIPLEAQLSVLPDILAAATETATLTNEILSRLGGRLTVEVSS